MSTRPHTCSLKDLALSVHLHLIGVLLVCINEEASEEAISPVRIIKESILFRVEDLQPYFIPFFEGQDGRARSYIMVACVGIKGPDTVLAIVNKANSQMFISQSYVICEVVDPRHIADELAAGCVVVATFIH